MSDPTSCPCGFIGLPIVMVIFSGLTWNPPLGRISRVPLMVIGTMEAPDWMARWNPPFLIGN